MLASLGPLVTAQQEVSRILSLADIRTDGKRPWDLVVHDERFYKRVLSGGVLALGESYMDGWWDCSALDELSFRAMRANLTRKVPVTFSLAWHYVKAAVFNRQTKRRSLQVGKEHYDRGNDLFTAMLDPFMQYSCGYWKDVDTLDLAQKAKMDLIARKLKLEKGMRVLDIGCGWGGLAKHLASEHGVSVVGVTISKEQAKLAKRMVAGLPVKIRVQDYRDLHETFDRIVSVGMFEHVGRKNYAAYFRTAARCLSDDGLFLLHTIGANKSSVATNPWTDKYIFPNGHLPSPTQIAAFEKEFVLEDWHSFGQYYDRTLLAWEKSFVAAWDGLKKAYSERFYRMWRFYLLTSAGAFRARKIGLWQLVLSKNGVEGGYVGER